MEASENPGKTLVPRMLWLAWIRMQPQLDLSINETARCLQMRRQASRHWSGHQAQSLADMRSIAQGVPRGQVPTLPAKRLGKKTSKVFLRYRKRKL